MVEVSLDRSGRRAARRLAWWCMAANSTLKFAMLYRSLAIAGWAIMLAACDDDFQKKKELAVHHDEEELALMRDLSRAGPEIERRLRERLQSKGSIVLIKDKDNGSLQAVPATIGWTADCNALGLSITLALPGEADGLELEISDAFLNDEDCKKLLPLTAVKVADILSGK